MSMAIITAAARRCSASADRPSQGLPAAYGTRYKIVGSKASTVGATASEGHLERVDDELGAEMVGHRPADDPPGEQVLDVREVQEPFPGRDVGDVRRPGLVRAVRAKVALNEVGSDPDARQPDGRPPALTRQQPGDSGRSHQPLHALTPDPDIVLEPQLGVDPPRAVGPVRGGVDLLDLVRQPGITQRPVRRRARSQPWKLVRFTPSARHITETGKFAFSTSISEKTSPTARRSPGRKKLLPS